ncbi:autotransporter adhesin BpaC-like isoform X2 [Drosophila pseudoobscura]|uniref:Autotransporter adhesin BpaC-like isoform X2 n=1 Tax=Drosophila pseudoobscura pseudoobscura TaxID=46245 RepID=A0A6I8VXZ7_DROPS|nr:autotransporter adhesin BpaC-like isoform X2 [Drosophila pseudoobscura]
METGAPLVVQSDDGQGQQTIVIRLMQPTPGANGQTQCMPISVHAIPLYIMPQPQQQQQWQPQQQQQQSLVDQKSPSSHRNQRYSTRVQSEGQYQREARTLEDFSVPPGKVGGRPNGNQRSRQVCYKVEYMLCPEDALYCQPTEPNAGNQFGDVRGEAPCCNQYCMDYQDSQAEKEFTYAMENIPRKCGKCRCGPSTTQVGTIPGKSEDIQWHQNIAQTSREESIENYDQMEQKTEEGYRRDQKTEDGYRRDQKTEEGYRRDQKTEDGYRRDQKTEDGYRRDQSTNTNAQGCPDSPNLEYIKTLCETLGRAMVACATAAAEAAEVRGKVSANLGLSASNWATAPSLLMQQTPTTMEEPACCLDSQMSITVENINPEITNMRGKAEKLKQTAENSSVESIGALRAIGSQSSMDSPEKRSSYTLRSIQQTLDVSHSKFRDMHHSSKGAPVSKDSKQSSGSSDNSARKTKSTSRVSTQTPRSSGSACASEGKSSARGSATTSERRSERPASSATEGKSSARGSDIATEKKKSSPRGSNQSALSIAKQRKKSSPSGSNQGILSSGISKERKKSSPRGSNHSVQSSRVSKEKNSSRCSDGGRAIRSPRSSVSVSERKSCGSAGASEGKSSARGSATMSERKSERPASSATEGKSSARGSDSATEKKKSSPRGSNQSVLSIAKERKKSSPRGSNQSVLSIAKERKKSSPRGSNQRVQSSGIAKEKNSSPRGSDSAVAVRSTRSSVSATERKSCGSACASEGKSSARGSATTSEQKSERPAASATEGKSSRRGSSQSTGSSAKRNSSASSKKGSSGAKPGGIRCPTSCPQSALVMSQARKVKTPSPSPEKRRDFITTVNKSQRSMTLKPLKCCTACKYINYCCCNRSPSPPKPLGHCCKKVGCPPWYC